MKMVRGRRKASSAIQKCKPSVNSFAASNASPAPKSKKICTGEVPHPSVLSPNKITKYYDVKQNSPNPQENSPMFSTFVNINVKQESAFLDDLWNKVLQETNIKLEGNRINIIWDTHSKTAQPMITEFFPVRRSIRKTKKTVLEEKRKTLEEAVLSNKEIGLDVRFIKGKGRGVVATQKFEKGQFVIEYAGELISMEEAQRREAIYARDKSIGCYMYYFKHRNYQHCIDATAETGRLGRLVNHSRNGNLRPKTIEVHGIPRLILLAKDDIEPGCELTYDYGDRSKESLENYPWLAL